VPQTSWLLKTLEFLLGGDALGFAHHHPEDALGAMLNTPAEIHENVGPNQSFRNAAFAIGGSSDATEVYPLATLSAPAKKALKMKQHFDADFQRGLLRYCAMLTNPPCFYPHPSSNISNTCAALISTTNSEYSLCFRYISAQECCWSAYTV